MAPFHQKNRYSLWIICENPLFLLPAYAKATADEPSKACFFKVRSISVRFAHRSFSEKKNRNPNGFRFQTDVSGALAHRSFSEGAVAQSVEQRTENPCVAGSIPAHTTMKIRRLWFFNHSRLFLWYKMGTTCR